MRSVYSGTDPSPHISLSGVSHPPSLAPSTSSNRNTTSSAYPPSASSRKGRKHRHGSRPPSSAAGSVFTLRSQSTYSNSDASTAITYPSPGSSNTELRIRNQRYSGLDRRASSSTASPTKGSFGEQEGFDISKAVEHPVSDLDAAVQSGGWTQEPVTFEDDDDSYRSWATQPDLGVHQNDNGGVVVLPRTSSLPHNQLDDQTTKAPRPQTDRGNGVFSRLRASASSDSLTPRAQRGRGERNYPTTPHMAVIDELGTHEEISARPGETSASPGLMAGLRKKLLSRRSSSDIARRDTDLRRSQDDGRVREASSSAEFSLDDQVARMYLGETGRRRTRSSPRKSSSSSDVFAVHARDNVGDNGVETQGTPPMHSPPLSRPDQLPRKSTSRNNAHTRKGSGEGIVGRLRLRPSSRHSSTEEGGFSGTKHTGIVEHTSHDAARHRSSTLGTPVTPFRLTPASRFELPYGSSPDLLSQVKSQEELGDRSASALSMTGRGVSHGTTMLDPQRPPRRDSDVSSSLAHGFYSSASNTRPSIESFFNAEHDRRWSNLGPAYVQQAEKRMSMGNNSTLPYASGRRTSSASARSSLFMPPNGRSLRGSKASLITNGTKTGSEGSSGAIHHTDSLSRSGLAPLERPRFSTNIFHPSGAASTLGHYSAHDDSDTESYSPAVAPRMFRGRPGSTSLSGLLGGGRRGFKGQTLDGSIISRPRLPVDVNKPLPPIPFHSFAANASYVVPVPDDVRYSGVNGSDDGLTQASVSQPSADFANKWENDNVAERQQSQLGPSPNGHKTNNDAPVRLEATLAAMLSRRQTQSFSDLLAHTKPPDERELSPWARPTTFAGQHRPQSVSSMRRPTFGLDLQPDAAAAFDSIPLPELSSNRRSRTSSLPQTDGIWLSSRPVSRVDGSYEESGRTADVPIPFDGPGDVSDPDDDRDVFEDVKSSVTPSDAHSSARGSLSGPPIDPNATYLSMQESPSGSPRSGEVEFLADAEDKSPPGAMLAAQKNIFHDVDGDHNQSLSKNNGVALTMDELREDGFLPLSAGNGAAHGSF